MRAIPIAALVAAVAAAGCSFNDTQNPAAPPGSGSMRIVQADPTSGNVDVYLDQTKVVGNATFGADTSIAGVPGGQHVVSAYAAGTTTNPLASATVQISNNTRYDFIVSGGTAGGVSLIGGVSEPAANHLASNAWLRLYDGIDTTDIGLGAYGAVNISLTGANPNNSYSFSKLNQFGSAPLNGQGVTGYQDIAPDTYTVLVTDTLGVDTAATGQITLSAGQLRTMIFTSKAPPTGTPPGTWLVVPDSA
jgi:hypothetical protein